MHAMYWTALLMALALAARAGDTGTDPANKYAWAENTGLANAASTGAGDLRNGMAWPNPRFTDNQDGTVTDKARAGDASSNHNGRKR